MDTSEHATRVNRLYQGLVVEVYTTDNRVFSGKFQSIDDDGTVVIEKQNRNLMIPGRNVSTIRWA